ncbi:hypothetical protein [Gordonia sp. WA4-43]|uniref:hypothetical protein n=1 Tax=Gordonia sp. WA4-43 TaxID=2878678 RepID=UPI001CF9843B|nr:hypothetical protein [Gordonia sp. WA4-43]UCZ89034.1 hypothetical protein LEL84_18540 [Gordonia sp. WA4-43]
MSDTLGGIPIANDGGHPLAGQVRQHEARVTDRQILEARQVYARWHLGEIVHPDELARHLGRMLAAVEEGRR